MFGFLGFTFFDSINNYGYTKNLNDLLSIFIAEALTIFQALKYEKFKNHQQFVIALDSKSEPEVIKYRKNFLKTHKVIQDMIQWLGKINRLQYDFAFVWVKFHS